MLVQCLLVGNPCARVSLPSLQLFCALGVFPAAEGAGNESEYIKEAAVTYQASLILGSQTGDLTVF